MHRIRIMIGGMAWWGAHQVQPSPRGGRYLQVKRSCRGNAAIRCHQPGRSHLDDFEFLNPDATLIIFSTTLRIVAVAMPNSFSVRPPKSGHICGDWHLTKAISSKTPWNAKTPTRVRTRNIFTSSCLDLPRFLHAVVDGLAAFLLGAALFVAGPARSLLLSSHQIPNAAISTGVQGDRCRRRFHGLQTLLPFLVPLLPLEEPFFVP